MTDPRPLSAQSYSAVTLERFWRRVRITDACWRWEGARNRAGYGTFFVREEQRNVPTHRFAYALVYGSLPDGPLDHICRVPNCVNPDHLEPVTHRENILRGIGPTAINAARTHCPQGHEFTPENLYLRPDGRRQCRACTLARNAGYKAKAKAFGSSQGKIREASVAKSVAVGGEGR